MLDRNKKLFYEDLKKIYLILEQRQRDINGYFDILNDKKCNEQKRDFIDNFLNDIKLTINKENRLSVINRLVNLMLIFGSANFILTHTQKLYIKSTL